MKVIKLTSRGGSPIYVVAAHVAAFWRMSESFAERMKVDPVTIVLLAGCPNRDDEGDLWVTELPEEITRMLLSGYVLEQRRERATASGASVVDWKEEH